MQRYNPKELETKWQKKWVEDGTYVADLSSKKPKYFGFAMFNYPSGAGIHVGHVRNYTIPDVITRAKRQQGFETYQPVGWDSFGLPAENFAIKTGISPQESTKKAIEKYREQYTAMGWGVDWTKEINTTDPGYYKWTQWIFTKLLEKGLAYQKESAQWWCESCKTVLADEQVIAGKCWRHDGPDDPFVSKKSLKQWFFKITEYADEILEATDALDWTPSVKASQKSWIGRSEGASVKFKLDGLGSEDNKEFLEVFTTAHDTIFGVTFMVVAPEHPIVSRYAQLAENSIEVQEYVQRASRKSELDREVEKNKTGIEVEGLFAVNPINGVKIPVWVADYVLMGYGTGAIMAVPGEDERDYEFAQKYGLPIVYTTKEQAFIDYQLIKANPEQYQLANSGEFDGLAFAKGREKILQKIDELQCGGAVVQYRMRDWLISRQRYWGAPIPVIHCPKDGAVAVPEKDLPVLLPEIENYQPTGGNASVLAGVDDWVNTPCPKCGGSGKRETDTMDGYVCSSWYFFRYLSPENTEVAWSKTITDNWMPVDFYNGGDHATAHLLYARFFTRFFNKIGLASTPEPFTRMVYNGKVRASDGSAFSKSKGNGVDPLDIISQGYGADALRIYEMFAAPVEQNVLWDPQGVPGMYRFLTRTWNVAQEYIESNENSINAEADRAILAVAHKTAKKVTEDIQKDKFNTAIATMMEAVNDYHRLKEKHGISRSEAWRFAVESLIQVLAPFAPHMADELWSQLGHNDTVHIDHWPVWDEAYLVSETMTIVVQVNGKVRAQLQIASDATEDAIVEVAKKDEKVVSYLDEKELIKTIYIKNKLVSFVVR